MAKYIYLQTVANPNGPEGSRTIYAMYGGEPYNLAFTVTEEEAKHFFHENYVRMEIHQLQLPKKKLVKKTSKTKVKSKTKK